MANPFNVNLATSSPLFQMGLGSVTNAISQSRQQQQQADNRSQAIDLLNQSRMAETTQDQERLFLDAFSKDPELIRKYMLAIRDQERSGLAQNEFELERDKLDQRKIESELRKSSTDLEKRKLENQLRLQQLKIEEEERQAIAESKGPNAISMLSDAKEAEKKASSFAFRMSSSEDVLSNLESKIDPRARVIGFISGGKGVTSEIANRAATPEEQEYASTASDFITAQLRKESGAAIGDSEFERKYREFFPMPGDSEAQIESKRKRRDRAVQAMKAESGGLYDALYSNDVEDISQRSTSGEAPSAALDYLKANPNDIDFFVEKYGYRPEGF